MRTSERAEENEAVRRVMDVLLIERSLVDDSTASPERIDRYVEILKQVEEGYHYTLKDPVDRAIAWVFDLALRGQIDPWDVDLVNFSKLYAKRVHKETGLDLVVVGRIIEMAWSIYRRKTERTYDDLLESLIKEEEEIPMGTWDWMEDEMDLMITHEVLVSEEEPLQRMVVHSGRRPVTLVELLDALKEAHEEAERIKKVRERRERLRRIQSEMGRKAVGERVYRENLEEDIKRVLSRINKYNGHPIAFKKLYGEEGIDLITAFIAILHLAKRGVIDVWQKKVPHGEIYVLNLKAKMDRINT
ncbi:MAG: hypothetical protein J7L88_01440 [Thermoplasmata archaeon]|nr:hypothetical protein [Thermoplasmata archaeon]